MDPLKAELDRLQNEVALMRTKLTQALIDNEIEKERNEKLRAELDKWGSYVRVAMRKLRELRSENAVLQAKENAKMCEIYDVTQPEMH